MEYMILGVYLYKYQRYIIAIYTYMELLFAVSETSQLVDLISKAFFFLSSQFPESSPVVRDLVFLHHWLMVTRSSTCTSLTCLGKWESCHSVVGNTEWVDEAKECLSLGDECGLFSGLIWVAISLLEISREMFLPSSSTMSGFLSVLDSGNKPQSENGILTDFSNYKLY